MIVIASNQVELLDGRRREEEEGLVVVEARKGGGYEPIPYRRSHQARE
jgi:hypothetical protein